MEGRREMWVITRVQMRIDSSFEQALADAVEREADDCPVCKSVLEAIGALPAHCPKCGTVRSTAWQERMEELACRVIAKGREKSC
jgi:tRNA(Ile2) C34 agmatinyltransferase TiaS